MRRAAAALALYLGAAPVPLHGQVAALAAPTARAPAPAQAPAAERAAPPRLTVGILGYRFQLSLPDSGDSIAGTATIRVARRRAGRADTLPLDLVAMSVREVRGGSAGGRLAHRYDGRVIRVVLPPAARPGPESVVVRYAGRPADGLLIASGAGGRRSFFADDWPDRARGFIPCLDHPAFKAPVTWEIEAPAGLRVVANGVLGRVTDLPGGRRRWRYAEPRPIPTYTMVLGAAPFAVSRHPPSITGSDTTANEVWAFPEDSAFADSVPFRRLTALVETASRIIGPFPYGKLAHVESSTRYGGMENSSAIFYARGMFAARRMGEGVVRHETAHQWFGDAVTERDWRHLWLSEGFASYFDLVFAAALGDDSALGRGMRAEARGYLVSEVVDRPLVDSAAQDLMGLLNANSYNKGAWLLHMLRTEVGDSAFFRGVREYYRTYRDSAVLSEDFERVMERVAGRDLGWFFGQWLYQPGYPQLAVDVQVDSMAKRAVVRVRQAQPVAWGRFRLPRVEVRFLALDEAIGDRAFALDSAQTDGSFTFDLPRAPTGLRIDPDGRLLLTAAVRFGP
jgi:aminopeptidase N